MKPRTILSVPILLLLLCAIAVPARAQTASPQETLNQYVSDLQKNPDDTALREKIIALAQTMRPAPTIPEEARRHMDRGIAASEGAKGEEDFRAASDEFKKATDLAPWLGDAYWNLATAQDKSGQYDAALNNLRLYLLTSPSPADGSWARSLINKVEYRKEKAAKEVEAKAKESSPEAIAARTQNAFDAFLNKIDGRRYRDANGGPLAIEVRRRRLVLGLVDAHRSNGTTHWGYQEIESPDANVAIQGLETTVPSPNPGYAPGIPYILARTYIVSEDGSSITMRCRLSDATTTDMVFLWQR